MSVATHLGLDPASTALVGLEQHWASWVEQFPRLARAGDLRSLRGWLAAAEPGGADEVLHALATLGSPSGGDDLAAASVLAWTLLPGACALAHRLHGLSPRIDEVVAAQLWLEVRSFPWHRLRKVAANILANTRAGVLRECGARSQTKRADKAWANTHLVDPAASFWNKHSAGLNVIPSAADELLALLDSARAANVITGADTRLLLSLVEAAERCGTTRTGRGNAVYQLPCQDHALPGQHPAVAVMSEAVAIRPAVSVAELQRAWHAVKSGQFRLAIQGDSMTDQPRARTVPSWTPDRREQVLPVVRCASAYGATTFALALATAANTDARVVECSSATTSGLAAASTAELGAHPSGWLQGTRGDVLLQRTGVALASLHDVPPPMLATSTLTVLDIGWELGQVLNTASWLAAQLSQAAAVIVVTCATVPGLRHLEGALSLLDSTPTVVAVVGPPRKRWPKPVQHSAGSLTRAADQAGRLVVIPWDRRLAVAGLDSALLPQALLDAAAAVLERVDLRTDRSR